MSLMDDFWAGIDKQLAGLRTAQTADDVIRVLGQNPNLQDGAADAFFGGGGGDETPYGALTQAGWTTVWYEAGYHYALKAPNGDVITYVEGDIYRGNRRPVPHNLPPCRPGDACDETWNPEPNGTYTCGGCGRVATEAEQEVEDERRYDASLPDMTGYAEQ